MKYLNWLLKVIKTGEGTVSVREIPNLPVEIKTGTLPQDIIVPKGLVLSESYAGILGDVKVPLIGSAKTATFISTRKTAPLPSGKRISDTEVQFYLILFLLMCPDYF